MATQLGVYQDALRLLGDIRLATLSDNVEARYALDDAWDDAIRYMLRQAAWRFALRTTSIAQSGAGVGGFDFSFAFPADWLRTHAIFLPASGRERPVDCREQSGAWYANLSPLSVRYVSTDYDDPEDWTEQFAAALAAHLAYSCCERITGDPDRTAQLLEISVRETQEAARRDALPEDPWFRHQIAGRLGDAVRYLLGQGLWRFAIKTVTLSENASATPSAGFAYAFDKPADWLRTVWLYEQVGFARRDIEFRDEGGDLHADAEEPVLRYLSATLGEDPLQWSDAFLNVLAAYLGWIEAIGTPDTAGAVIEARQNAYNAALKNAQIRDDANERPKVDRRGTFTRARGGLVNREQGY